MPQKTKYEQFQTIPENQDYKGWLEHNITIAECNNYNGIETSHIMYDKTKIIIGYIEKDGKLHFTKEYIDKVKEQAGDYYKELGLEDRQIYLNELPGLEEYVTSSDKKLEPEELEILKENTHNQKEEKEQEKKKKTGEENKEEYKDIDAENRQIEQDLGLKKEDIVFSAQIKDPEFCDRVPALRGANKPAKLIYTKSGKAMLVSPTKANEEEYEQIAGISEPKNTNRRALNVGRDGTLFQEEVIMGEFQIKGYEGEYSLGWVIGTGGYPELRELRYERTNDPMANMVLLAAPVETETEKPITPEVRRFIDQSINIDTAEEMDNLEKLEEKGQTPESIEQIQDDAEEPNSQKENEDDDDLGERIRSLFEDPRRHH